MLFTDINEFINAGGFRPGDIGLSFNPDQRFVGKAIISHQNWIAPDKKSNYSHAFLIVNEQGDTFESGIKIPGMKFHRIGSQNIYEKYSNYRVCIIRHEDMTEQLFNRYFPEFVEKYNHKLYPYWRLPYYFIPPIARRVNATIPVVCSELVACFYYTVKILKEDRRLMRFYLGVYPDYLYDMGDLQYGQKKFKWVFEGCITTAKGEPVCV